VWEREAESVCREREKGGKRKSRRERLCVERGKEREQVGMLGRKTQRVSVERANGRTSGRERLGVCGRERGGGRESAHAVEREGKRGREREKERERERERERKREREREREKENDAHHNRPTYSHIRTSMNTQTHSHIAVHGESDLMSA